MSKIFANRAFICMACVLGIGSLMMAYGQTGPGNPRPGYPHDTIIIHVMKADSGPKACNGGHSLFLRHIDGVVQEAVLTITMTDWVQLDNDGDGLFDEDPFDGIDNDGDLKTDEDPIEPGAVTTAIDCDALNDNKVSLQIRDTDPRKGFVSTQEWFARMIGKPEQNFAFTTYADQVVSCTVLEDPDGIPNTGDETVECTYGGEDNWVELASFNLASEGCVKSVKLGGKNGVSAGGKTPFCDITDGFMVNVDTDGDGSVQDTDGDGIPDEFFIFGVSCVDNPATLDIDESLYCPLSSMIWEIDTEETTSQAKAQLFVSHTGSASIQSGKIK
jgi:hypothetical protein